MINPKQQQQPAAVAVIPVMDGCVDIIAVYRMENVDERPPLDVCQLVFARWVLMMPKGRWGRWN